MFPGISNFLEISSLSHSIVFLYFFALITKEGFLISPCCSLELCIQMAISFLFCFAFHFFSQLFARPHQTTILPFFFLGMVLITITHTHTHTHIWISQVVQVVENLPMHVDARDWFNPWAGKIPWRRKWQPTPVFLPRKSHGQRFMTLYRRQGSRLSPRKRNTKQQNGCLRRPYN